MNVAFFDLDGTITCKDTLLRFIRFSKGNLNFYIGFILLMPVLISYRIGFIPNWRAKELFFSYFFKGMKADELSVMGNEFAKSILPDILRPEAIRELEIHKKEATKIVIVTASSPIWTKSWCDLHRFDLIATDFEINEGRYTGLIKGANCFGQEKVRRIKERFDLSVFDQVYAYGDSSSDRAMLDLADVKFMKWKRIN